MKKKKVKARKGKKVITDPEDFDRASKNFYRHYKHSVKKGQFIKSFNDYFGSDASPELRNHVLRFGVDKGYTTAPKVTLLHEEGKAKPYERNTIAYVKGRQVFAARYKIKVRGKIQVVYRDSKGRYASIKG